MKYISSPKKKMEFFRHLLMLFTVVFAKQDRSWYSFHTGFLLPGLFSLIATKSYDILNSWIFQIDLFTTNHLTFNETWSPIKDKLQYFKKSLLPYVSIIIDKFFGKWWSIFSIFFNMILNFARNKKIISK